jgi:hypothetical protein
MNRLLVALLAAVDALIAAAAGVAVILAPLTVFWVVGLGGTADWGALWPASVRIWQFGQLVPLQITLPPEYLTATGIPVDASSFWLSLAPLAFAAFTAVFAARSGARSARAGAWIVGVLAGAAVTAVLAALLWRTSGNPIASVYGWQALVLPTAVFAVPALIGALVGAWRHGDDGPVDAVWLRAERGRRWASVPEASARGVGIAVAGFVAVGALFVVVATIARGGEVIALFEAAHVDAAGATMIAIAQLAYLPTLVVWGGAYAAGPGFAIGTGTAVSPAGTNLGVLPGMPVLGIIPETVTHWMLASALLIVAVGFAAGAAARGRLTGSAAAEASAPRLATLAAIVVGGAVGVAVLSAAASGGIGPGRLAETGPATAPVAFAVGAELLVGAAIALFTPVRRRGADGGWVAAHSETVLSFDEASALTATTRAATAPAAPWIPHDAFETEPLDTAPEFLGAVPDAPDSESAAAPEPGPPPESEPDEDSDARPDR